MIRWLTALFLGLGTSPAWGAQAICPKSEKVPVKFKVTTSIPQAKLDHTRTQKQIQRIAGDSSVLALTNYKTSISQSSAYKTIRWPGSNKACAYLAQLNIHISFENGIVYIPRRFPKKSCAFREALVHEASHVLIAKTVLKRQAARVRKDLAAIAQKIPPVPARNLKLAKRRMERRLDRAFKTYSKRIDRDNKRSQKKIDTPKEYAKVYAKCKTW